MARSPRKITKAALAKLAGTSRAGVTKNKDIVTDANGGIDLDATLANLDSTEQADRRRANADANLKELLYKEKSGELVDLQAECAAWASTAQTTRERITALPDSVAKELAALTDARMVRDRLAAEIRQCLTGLPDEIRKKVA
jgi:phage terminase Nu1 subunit (DNA packaging protein)